MTFTLLLAILFPILACISVYAAIGAIRQRRDGSAAVFIIHATVLLCAAVYMLEEMR
jgi:hypothetical protein